MMQKGWKTILLAVLRASDDELDDKGDGNVVAKHGDEWRFLVTFKFKASSLRLLVD